MTAKQIWASTWGKVAVVIAAVLALLITIGALAGDQDDEAVTQVQSGGNRTIAATTTAPSAATSTTSPAQVPAAATTAAAAVIELSGHGPSSTDGFSKGASPWRACFTMSDWATLSSGEALGIIYVDVKRESDGRTVANLAGDASKVASREGCTTVREAGRFYFAVNTGAGMGWRLTAQ